MERNTRARKEPQKYMRKNSANKWGMERYVKNKENKKKYKIDTRKMGSWWDEKVKQTQTEPKIESKTDGEMKNTSKVT